MVVFAKARENAFARWKWVALWFLFALLLSAGGMLNYRFEKTKIHREIYQELAVVGELKANEIAQWRKERLGDVNNIAGRSLFKITFESWLGNKGDAQLLDSIVQRLELLRESYGYVDVLLYALDGSLLLSLQPTPPPLSEETKNAIAESLKKAKPVISNVFRQPSGSVNLDTVAPLLDGGNTAFAILVLRYNPETYLYPLIQAWPTSSNTAESLLATRDGDDVLFLNELRHQSHTTLSLRFPLTLTTLPAVQAVLGKTGEFQGLDYRETPVLTDLRPIPDSPWYIVSKIDYAEILGEAWSRAILIFFVVMLLIALATALMAYAFRQRQTLLYRSLYSAERQKRHAQEIIRATLYSIGDAVITSDIAGNVQIMNPIAETLTGWPEADARNRPLTEVFRIINEYTRKSVENPVQSVLREGAIVGLANHTLLIARDGRETSIADAAAPILDAQGVVAGVVLVFRDQTAENDTKKALRKSKETAERYLNIAAEIIVALDAHGNITLLNDSGHDLLGYERGELIGLNWFETFVPEATRAQVQDVFQQIMRGKLDNTAIFENAIHTKTGEAKVILWHNTLLEEDGVITGTLSSGEDITGRKDAEAALSASERRYRELVENANSAILRVSPKGIVTFINEYAQRFFEFSSEEVLGRSIFDTFVPMRDSQGLDLETYILDACANPDRYRFGENENIKKNGERVWFAWTNRGVYDVAGNLVELLCIGVDITARKNAETIREKLEDQLRQAQKMEAVGRLAGGVAHDFNNMLGVILGHVDIALEDLPKDSPLQAGILQIKKAAERSAALTRQLLGFARKQPIAPVVLDVNKTIENTLNMLKRLIGENISLQWHPMPGVWHIFLDPGQADQILTNLTVNARDAIGGIGVLSIATENRRLETMFNGSHMNIPAGLYAVITVTDSGCGMDKETLEHIFDPFFTTKELGKGTGLGLATIYGIVTQNNGFIEVVSQPEHGATFQIFFPAYDVETPLLEEKKTIAPMERGTETILAAEDDASMLELTRMLLERLGYRVHEAVTPEKALEIAAKLDGNIDLLLTDVIMPRMNGRALYTALQQKYPGLKCLYMSGHADNVIGEQGVLSEGVQFIPKPFTLKELAAGVRKALDQPS